MFGRWVWWDGKGLSDDNWDLVLGLDWSYIDGLGLSCL